MVKLIQRHQGNLDRRLAYREAGDYCGEAANRIMTDVHSRSTGQTLRDLRELLSVTLDTIIVVEFEGEQTRLNYGGRSAEDVIAMLRKRCILKGASGWKWSKKKPRPQTGLIQHGGTVAKLAMRQPFVLFKGLTFQKLCLPGAFRRITIIKC